MGNQQSQTETNRNNEIVHKGVKVKLTCKNKHLFYSDKFFFIYDFLLERESVSSRDYIPDRLSNPKWATINTGTKEYH